MRQPDIVPAGWVEYGRKVAAASMTLAACDVNRPDVTELNPATNIIENVPGEPVLSGAPCRVQRLGPERITNLAQQQAIFANYLIAVKYGEDDINVGDIVRVTTSLDATLVGRPMRVSHVMVGSLTWERDLYCNDDMSHG